jgi:hypothetical protein
MIPFAALLIAGVADTLWEPASSRLVEAACRLIVLAAAATALIMVIPQWAGTLARQAGRGGEAGTLAAAAWVEHNVPKRDVVVVDDYLWLDLKRAGLNPLWVQKTSSNAQSQGELPDGWRSIGYVVMSDQIVGTIAGIPLLQQAVNHSVPVAKFGGGLVVRRVMP